MTELDKLYTEELVATMQEAYCRCCASYAATFCVCHTVTMWENSSYKQACFAKSDYFFTESSAY